MSSYAHHPGEWFDRKNAHGLEMRPASMYAWASARIALGIIFAWAFLDKTFGLGYTTKSANAWIHGGNPTMGYLSSSVGPFAGFFKSIAGQGATNLLFMGGLAAVGAALILGIGIRLAGYGGVLMMAFMYASHTPWSTPTANPLVDDHVVYAIVLLGLTLVHAGATFGLGRWWTSTSLVRDRPILE